MPIDLKTRLDLAKSDPNLVTWVFHGGVEPEDLYLHQKLGGDFLRYEEMLQDTQIAGKLFERVGAVLGRSILIDAGGKDKKSRDAASIARRILDIPDPAELERRKKAGEDVYVNRLIPYEQICSNFLLSGLLCGFSVQAVTGARQVDNLLLPNLEVIPQRRFIFSYHEPEKAIPICTDEKLDPKKDIALVNGYELRLLTKRSPIDGERCPKNRFFTFTYGSLRGIPWGLGLGYRLRKFYEIRSECLKSAVLGGDRLGSPPVHGIYPDTINPTDLEHKAILDAFNRLLQAISPNAHASTSPGFEVKFLEPKSGGHDLIEWLYNTATAEISNGVWGDRSYAEKETGSFAAQSSQNESRNENITDNDCNSLDEQLASQLWQWIGEHNFPDASFPVIRRETASERRKLQMESEQEDLRAKKLATDRQLILDVGCNVEPAYITATYGEAFTLPPPPEEEEQPSEELEPEAEETEEFAANVDRFLDWQGLRLGLRYPPGATRFPQYRSSKKLQNGYGFIQGVKQNGKALRCYLHPDLLTGSQDGRMFAIAQLDPKTGEEDELKYMLGYPSLESAELAYRREMPEVFFGGIREISADELADFSETKVYGIWFQGRNTPYVTRAGDRNDAIRKARASKCAGWDRDVVSCRPLSGKYLEQAKKGQWVRLRANGTEEGGSFKFRPQLKPDYAEKEEEDVADIYEQRLAEQLTEGYGSAIAIVQQFAEQINSGEGTSEEKYRRFSEGIYDLFEQMPVEALSQVLGEGLAAGYFAGMYEERADGDAEPGGLVRLQSDFAETVADEEVLDLVKQGLEITLGRITRLVGVIQDDEGTFKGECQQSVNPRLTKRFGFTFGRKGITFKALNGEEIEQFSEGDDGIEDFARVSKSSRANKSLKCKIKQCGGRCLKANETCRLDFTPEQEKLWSKASEKSSKAKPKVPSSKPKEVKKEQVKPKEKKQAEEINYKVDRGDPEALSKLGSQFSAKYLKASAIDPSPREKKLFAEKTAIGDAMSAAREKGDMATVSKLATKFFSKEDLYFKEYSKRQDKLDAQYESLKSEIIKKHKVTREDAQRAIEKVNFDDTLGDSKKSVKEDLTNFYLLTGGKGFQSLKQVEKTEERAFAMRRGGRLNVGYKVSPHISLHELGHHIEYESDRVGEASVKWRDSRATSLQPERLNKISRTDSYGDDEVAVPGKFLSPYVGRVYDRRTTEVVSVGLENFTDGRSMRNFREQDKGHFDYVMGVLLSED